MTSPIIVSLDTPNLQEAAPLIKTLQGHVWGFKVNSLLLQGGTGIIPLIKNYGKVMADPKLFDIPSTVHRSVQALKDAGADIITFHGISEYQPHEDERDHLAAVTVLTSQNLKGRENLPQEIAKSYRGQCRYAVCSAGEARGIRDLGFIPICPGIRLDPKGDDQTRVYTPKQARALGAGLIVVGRPIIEAVDPLSVVKRFMADWNSEDGN